MQWAVAWNMMKIKNTFFIFFFEPKFKVNRAAAANAPAAIELQNREHPLKAYLEHFECFIDPFEKGF